MDRGRRTRALLYPRRRSEEVADLLFGHPNRYPVMFLSGDAATSDGRHKVAAWQARRNRQRATINWRFTAQDARIKLKRLYPTIASADLTQVGRNEV